MKTGPKSVRWCRPPQQERSRKTLDRLLDAAESLLNDRTFEELTIGDVVRGARSSVGAFYARFADKEALAAALYERHQLEAIATLDAYFDAETWKGVPVERLVSDVVHMLVDLHRGNRGLLRALVLHGYLHPDPRYGDAEERSRLAIARLGKLIGSRTAEIGHGDAPLAASLGLLMVLATLREKILFGESTAAAVELSDRALERELTRAYLAYLGVRPRGAGGKHGGGRRSAR